MLTIKVKGLHAFSRQMMSDEGGRVLAGKLISVMTAWCLAVMAMSLSRLAAGWYCRVLDRFYQE